MTEYENLLNELKYFMRPEAAIPDVDLALQNVIKLLELLHEDIEALKEEKGGLKMDRVDNTVPRHTKNTKEDLEDEIRTLRIRVERLELMVNKPYKPDLTYKAVSNNWAKDGKYND